MDELPQGPQEEDVHKAVGRYGPADHGGEAEGEQDAASQDEEVSQYSSSLHTAGNRK